MPYIDDFWRVRACVSVYVVAMCRCICMYGRVLAVLRDRWFMCGAGRRRPKFQLFAHARPLIDIATDAEISVGRARHCARWGTVRRRGRAGAARAARRPQVRAAAEAAGDASGACGVACTEREGWLSPLTRALAHQASSVAGFYRRELEMLITRPHFHVMPLDEAQLEVWRKCVRASPPGVRACMRITRPGGRYLDREEQGGNEVRVGGRACALALMARTRARTDANYVAVRTVPHRLRKLRGVLAAVSFLASALGGGRLTRGARDYRYANWKDMAVGAAATVEVLRRAADVFVKDKWAARARAFGLCNSTLGAQR